MSFRLTPLMVVAAVLSASRVPAMTVEEIPPLLKAHSDEVQAAHKDVEAAEAGVWAARARYLPSLDLKSVYVHLGADLTLQIPTQTVTIGGFSGSLTLPPVPLQQPDIALSTLVLKMPLFAGGRISAGVDAAKAEVDEANALEAKTTEEKTAEALKRYFGVQAARGVLATLTQMKETLDRIRTISEGLVKSGLGARFFILQVKVAQADLQSRLSEARGKAELADLAFKVSLGRPSVGTLAYETPLKKIVLPGRVDLFRSQALAKRREFAVLKAKENQVHALKAYQLGRMLPALYAVGSQQLITSNLPVFEPGFAVGVVLDIPLTGWLESLPEQERAIKLREKVEILRARAEREIPLQIDKLYTEAQTADAAYKALEEASDLAKEALRLAEVRFKNGDGSAVEVLRAETDWEKSQVQQALLSEEFNRKLIELYEAAGDVPLYIEAYVNGTKGKGI